MTSLTLPHEEGKESKNILIFSTAYHPHIGGAEIAIAEITKRLSSDYNFTLLTYRFRKTDLPYEVIGKLEVRRLGHGTILDRLFLFPYLAFFSALKIVREKKIDLMWVVMVSYAGIGAYFLKLIKPKIPFLLTLQEGDPEEHLQFAKLGMLGFWWKRLVTRADYIQAISTYLADYALKAGAKNKIAIVPNGVEIAKFNAKIAKSQTKTAKEISYDSHTVSRVSHYTFITTFKLLNKNGIDILIRAARELKFQIPNSKFQIRIVGGGPLELQLKSLANKLQVEDVIEFAGSVPNNRIYEELAKADIFVRPSRSEGLGSSFLEAMAAGLPVIGTNVGGIPDFLANEQTGLFTKIDDQKDLAEQIRKLGQDQNLRKRIIDNGRKLVQDRYSWDAIASQMKTIFEELL